MIDILPDVSGFLVGMLVGMTGVGGGSLMAPIMILLLGVAPTTAVGTDLWFAAITKVVGGGLHHRHGIPIGWSYGAWPMAHPCGDRDDDRHE